MNGLFAAFGEPIRQSEGGVWLEGTQIVDIAPTALHLTGLPVPQDMDGRVLVEALRDEYADPASIRYGPPARRTDTGEGEDMSGEMSAEDEAIIKERLRDLGYVA
jgi:arylsulfatase A-like enzyme